MSTRRSTRSQTAALAAKISSPKTPKTSPKTTKRNSSARPQNQPTIDRALTTSKSRRTNRQLSKDEDVSIVFDTISAQAVNSARATPPSTSTTSTPVQVVPRSGKRGRESTSTSSSNASRRIPQSPQMLSGFSTQSTAGSSVMFASPSVSVVSSCSTSSGKSNRSKTEEEQILKDFDLNVLYGACRGVTRRERYERAIKYSLNPLPDQEILDILNEHDGESDYDTCIWDKYEMLRMVPRR